jgi:hypothetical protein
MILGVIFRINYFVSPVWIAFVVIVFVFIYIKPKYVFVGLAFVAGMVLAFFRVTSELDGENYVRQFFGLNVTVQGVVDGDPETDEKGTKVKLTGLKFGDDRVYETTGSIFASLRQNAEIRRSDSLI